MFSMSLITWSCLFLKFSATSRLLTTNFPATFSTSPFSMLFFPFLYWLLRNMLFGFRKCASITVKIHVDVLSIYHLFAVTVQLYNQLTVSTINTIFLNFVLC